MTRHYLVYSCRRIVRRPAGGAQRVRDTRPGEAAALLSPAVHAFGQRWLYEAPGDVVVWIVSSLQNRAGALPPAIDARIRVAARHRAGAPSGSSYVDRVLQRYRYAFVADPAESRYLPWSNALPLLADLRFHGARESLPPELCEGESPGGEAGPYTLLGRHLQTPRLLTDDSAGLLERYAVAVRDCPRAFISYRWREGTETVADLVLRLSAIGVAAWWDRWCMPRRVAEGDDELANDLLWLAIERGMADSSYGLAVRTSSYGLGGATAQELRAMEDLERQGRLTLLDVVPGQTALAVERLRVMARREAETLALTV